MRALSAGSALSLWRYSKAISTRLLSCRCRQVPEDVGAGDRVHGVSHQSHGEVGKAHGSQGVASPDGQHATRMDHDVAEKTEEGAERQGSRLMLNRMLSLLRRRS